MSKNKKYSLTKTYKSLPIIDDCFCGIGSWMHRDRLLPYKTEDILALMNHFGIRKTLVHSNFATDGGADERGNQYVISECKKTNGRLIPALVVRPNPHKDDIQMSDYLNIMQDYGVRAIWIVPKGQSLWTWLYGKIMEECSQRKLPIFIHRENTTPDQLYNLLTMFPRVRIVLCGVSYGEDWWLYPLLHQFKELRVCTGHFYIPSYNPMRFLEHFPATRLIFGSGLPFFSPGGMIAHITYATIPESDKRLIFYENLENLLNEAEL